MRSLNLSKIEKSKPSIQKFPSQKNFESITVSLDACQIAMFRDKKNESFKMSDFQRILVSKKEALKTCHPFSQSNYGNKSF